MASLFRMDRILYQCGCEEWWPLCSLYFCRHCSTIRCTSCSLNEIDSTFCPNCLENIPAGEARVKKNRCVNCNQCPICGMVLTTRAVGELCHLMCSTCRWSTRDSDTPDQPSSGNWPVSVLFFCLCQQTFLKDLTFNDSFDCVVPELDLSCLIGDSVEDFKPSLDSGLRQPLAGDRPLRPVRMPLRARRAVRCKNCDHNLVKLEYGTSTIRYKIQYFARNFVPEIRLSREPEICEGENGSVLLTVANESNSKAEVSIRIFYISRLITYYRPGTVVFRRRHRAGIRLEVKSREDHSSRNILSLLVKYKNEQCSMQMNADPEWKMTRVHIFLAPPS
uniref:Dynactin subunit 4 n=1 Tax=Angiostrongylus cantonensis TaxID=6313 RepID=A0A0K0DHU9_ANGCA